MRVSGEWWNIWASVWWSGCLTKSGKMTLDIFFRVGSLLGSVGVG